MRPTRSATTHTTTTQAEVAVTVAAASTTTTATTEDASPSPFEVLVEVETEAEVARWKAKTKTTQRSQQISFLAINPWLIYVLHNRYKSQTFTEWGSFAVALSYSPLLPLSFSLCSRSKKWQWLLLLLLSEGLQSPFSFNQRFFTRLSGSWIAFELIKILMRSLQCCKTTTAHKHKNQQAARLLRLLFETHLQLKLQKESKLYIKIPRMANNTYKNMYKHAIEACSGMSRQNTVRLHSHCK